MVLFILVKHIRIYVCIHIYVYIRTYLLSDPMSGKKSFFTFTSPHLKQCRCNSRHVYVPALASVESDSHSSLMTPFCFFSTSLFSRDAITCHRYRRSGRRRRTFSSLAASVRSCTTSSSLPGEEEHGVPATSVKEAAIRAPPTSFCIPPPPFSLQPPSYTNAWGIDPFRTKGQSDASEERNKKGETAESTDAETPPSPLPSTLHTGSGEEDANAKGGEQSTSLVMKGGSGTSAECTSPSRIVPPLVGDSFLLWSPFIPSTVDLHQALLLEAHEKHGVDIDVPPQAPPSSTALPTTDPVSPGSTPEAEKPDEVRHDRNTNPTPNAEPMGGDGPHDEWESASTEQTESHRAASPHASNALLFQPPTPTPVPLPWYPPALARKMQDVSAHFQYPPTHGPPPLHTTGSHTLADSWHLSSGASGSVQSQQQLRSWRSRYQRALALRQAEWKAMWQRYRKKWEDHKGALDVMDGASSSASAAPSFRFLEEEESMAVQGSERTIPPDRDDALLPTAHAPKVPPPPAAPSDALARTTGQPPSTSSSPHPSPMDADVIRAAVQADMRFHCRVCGRGYRHHEVAVEHARLRHVEELLRATSASATRPPTVSAGGEEGKAETTDPAHSLVADGPGKGEIIAVITNDSHPPSAPAGRQGKPGSSSSPSTTAWEDGGTREAEKEAHVDTMPAKATPTGAARALKRRLVTTCSNPIAVASPTPTIGIRGGGGSSRKKGLPVVPSAAAATKGSSATPLQRLSIRERSGLYANPFGAAAEAAAEAAKLEEQEPVNPFKVHPESATAPPPISPKRPVEGENSGEGTTPENREAKRCFREKEEGGECAAWSSATFLATALHGTGLYRDMGGTPSRFYCPLCLLHSSTASRLGHFSRPNGITENLFSFRLLDSLLDHLEAAHTEEGGVDALPPEVLQALYDQQNYPWRTPHTTPPLLPGGSPSSCRTPPPPTANALPSGVPPLSAPAVQETNDVVGHTLKEKKDAVVEEEEEEEGPARDAVPHGSSVVEEVLPSVGNGNKSDLPAMAPSPSVAPKVESITPVPSSSSSSSSSTTPAAEMLSIRLHSRLLCTTILRGIIMDVQHGYTAKRFVLQYVVKVIGREKRQRNAVEQGGDSTTGIHASEENTPVENGVSPKGDEEELIVVRYQGEPTSFTALRSTIHVGSDVVAIGNLRLDRRLDTLSKRYHAYPVVIIVPPFGSIRVVS